METEEGSAGVVGFMTPRIGVLMLRCGHGSDIVSWRSSPSLLGMDRAD